MASSTEELIEVRVAGLGEGFDAPPVVFFDSATEHANERPVVLSER